MPCILRGFFIAKIFLRMFEKLLKNALQTVLYMLYYVYKVEEISRQGD